MRARLSSSHVVGRAGELAELELALREAAAERPVVVLLGGDSGVGKTRLISEFEARAAEGEEPATVLRGETVEQGDGELPYAPLLSALRPLVRERHRVFAELSAGSRGELAALLPGLADGPGAASDDRSAQLRLFEALLELLEMLSCQAPVVLIVEDVHWADRSTRGFIAYLARSLRRERVMVLLSYRTDELHRRHPLRPLLSELERLERARRIELAPLDRAELSEVLADILGGAPGHELLERLYRRGEGNPLYTEELLAAGLDGRGAAPQSLRDAFLLRIERLPETAQRAARALAVARRLDQAALCELTGLAPETLMPALREAVAEQVLVADAEGGFGFRHALLREALYDDLLPGERSELHLELARCFEQRPLAPGEREVERAAMVANHYAAAGEQRAALRTSVRAAVAARAVHAYGEAADLAERALELWPRVEDPAAEAGMDRVALLMLASDAHSVADDRSRSEILLRSALEQLDPDRDRPRYAAVLARVARVQWAQNRPLEGVETAQRALALLDDCPDMAASPERAALLSWLSRTLYLRGKFRAAEADGEKALATVREIGDRRLEAEVLNTLGMSRISRGAVEHGIECLRTAIELAREVDDLDGLAYAYGNLADLLEARGRMSEALDTAREGLATVPRRLRQANAWLHLTVSDIAFETGDWRAAREHLGADPVRLSGMALLFRLLREAGQALGDGDDERAGGRLAEAAELVAHSSLPQWIGGYGVLLGELRRRQGDLPGARQAVATALDRIEVCTDDIVRIARVTAVGARVEADVAQRARDLRETAAERDAVKRARLHVQRLRAIAQDGGPVEAAWSLAGAAELTRARGRPDPAAWAKSVAAFDELGLPYLAALSRWRQAEAAAEAGERDSAARVAAESLAVAERLGAAWLRGELQGLIGRARLEVQATEPVLQSDRARADGRTDGDDPFGLTPRERQVLALIAEGATNRQIGAALYMAEKTASVHVSRILAKLGVRSRTQAAAVAHRMHLHR